MSSRDIRLPSMGCAHWSHFVFHTGGAKLALFLPRASEQHPCQPVAILLNTNMITCVPFADACDFFKDGQRRTASGAPANAHDLLQLANIQVPAALCPLHGLQSRRGLLCSRKRKGQGPSVPSAPLHRCLDLLD